MTFDFRGSDPSITHDGRYDAPIYRYSEISDIPWDSFAETPGQKVRIIVQPQADILPLDMLYVPRDHSGLLVGIHGALGRDKAELPVFQYAQSFGQFRKESVLLLFDPTLLLNPRLRIGWMMGDHSIDVAAEYARLIRNLVQKRSIEHTVLTGHSAGGFIAARIGSMVPNSHAISVNGQFVSTLHRPWERDMLHNLAFTEFPTHEALFESFRDRLDLSVALDRREPTSSLTWFTNTEDHLSFGDHPQLAEVCSYFDLPMEGGVTAEGDMIVLTDYMPADNVRHSLPGSILPFLQLVMGERTTIEVHPQFNPHATLVN